VAATEARDKGFAELVQQRTTEKNWDSARTRVSIDIDHACALDATWVETHGAVFGEVDLHAVELKQTLNYVYI
jgi:hypothetical protein